VASRLFGTFRGTHCCLNAALVLISSPERGSSDKMTFNRVISILQILVWFSSPLLVLQQGEIYANHSGVEEIADGITTSKAVQSVQFQSLKQIDAENFAAFLTLHVNQPSDDESGHYHTSFDGCCGLGGVVCDASMVSNLRLSQDCQTLNHIAWGNLFYSGIDVPTLRHPPKPISSFISIQTVRARGFESN